MARYTSAKIFSSVGGVETRNVIPDAGTSVIVEYYTGTQWVTDPSSPISAPNIINCRGISVRLTPDSGGFFIDEVTYK